MASSPTDPGLNTQSPVTSQLPSIKTISRKPRQKKPEQKPRRSNAAPTNSPTIVSGPDVIINNNTSTAAQAVLPQPTTRGSVPQYSPTQFIMNTPSYPVNGAAFSTQQYQSQPPGPPTGPGMPSQYTFHLPGPYHAPPPGYTYAQYPSPTMVMVPPQRPAAAPHTTQDQPAPSPAPRAETGGSGGKRKRKSEVSPDIPQSRLPEKPDEDPVASGSNMRIQKVQTSTSADSRKRTKTQRACDSCRTRKIRCDILPDSEPATCQHCKQYGFDCTFFLPITETRFKKKKLEEEAAEKEKVEAHKSTASPQMEPNTSDVNVFGPTSALHLLHSLPSISSRVYESYDSRYQIHMEVSKDGDGVLHVEKFQNEERQKYHVKPVETRVEPDKIEKLLNVYFSEIAPIFPIITKAEFLANSSPPAILIYSMCLVAAARRGGSQDVFDSLRTTVNSLLKTEDVFSRSAMANVQAMLILCMLADAHSQFVPHALSALWIRLGTAIRMAQDLGLHRAEAVKQDIEIRRRIWAACVISDRWTGVTYGHPFMIDVHDCDARLPSSGDPNDAYIDELLRLSILLGRVLKTIYSPSGLAFTDDKMLNDLLHDIHAWRDNLPDVLKFKGPESSRSAGMLHLLYACVSVIFWRVFMRTSFSTPSHLKFGATMETWTGLVEMTGSAIEWLDAHEDLFDVWLLIAYAATSCGIVQYNHWARRKDQESATHLRKLRDCVRRWEASLSPDHMSTRRKTAEIIILLYEATQSPAMPNKSSALNPTSGVTVADPSRTGVDQPEGELTSGDQSQHRRTSISGVRATSSPTSHQRGGGSTGVTSSLVNLTPLPLGGNHANVNPAMNLAGNVQVMSVLEVPQVSGVFEQFDMDAMDVLPRGLFDWIQWDFLPRSDVVAVPAAFLQG